MNDIKRKDLLKHSVKLKNTLKKRLFDELSLSYTEIVNDAYYRGKTITKSSLSKYFTKDHPINASLSHENILWLCLRYCIDINLIINLSEYTMKKSLNNLNIVFPESVKKDEKGMLDESN